LSLVIALAASREAVIGGDRRAISFLGDCSRLEEELYTGQIRDDQELLARTKELKASLQVSDGKEKVWRQGRVLVGEVTEISASLSRRRRIYLLPGAHIIVDITNRDARITGKGKLGCVILGNRFTQALAAEEVARGCGRVSEAMIKGILTKAAKMTASVSREHIILRSDALQPDPGEALMKALEEDCRKGGWRL
jgi:hypothetical protein